MIAVPQKQPFRCGRIDRDRIIIELVDLIPAHKKDIIAIRNYIPYVKTVIMLWKQLFKGIIDQLAILIRREIPEVILAAGIDPVICTNGYRTDDELIGQRIVLPVIAIKAQKTLIIGEIHHPVPVLHNSP